MQNSCNEGFSRLRQRWAIMGCWLRDADVDFQLVKTSLLTLPSVAEHPATSGGTRRQTAAAEIMSARIIDEGASREIGQKGGRCRTVTSRCSEIHERSALQKENKRKLME